jgi:hypothetical protein
VDPGRNGIRFLNQARMKLPLASITLAALLAACGVSSDGSTDGSSNVSEAELASTRPTPRYDDGTVRLDRVPGEKGYWGQPSVSSLIEVGVDVAMDSRGLLANIDDADKVAPFRPWALALYKYRQRNGLADDPVQYCLSPGSPRHMHDERGFRIVQDRNYNRVYILFGGGNRNWRLIHMDGRTPPDPEEVVGTYFGHSTGQWVGDTFIVQSSGFNDRFWFSNGGLPHTSALRLVERFSRPNFDTLRYEVTIDDPLTYTRPWTAAWTLRWMHGEEIEEHFCEQ